MAFSNMNGDDHVMNEINMTPLVDVMLVLLIIFIVTLPVMHHSVNIQLPEESAKPLDVKPNTLTLSVDAKGDFYLDNIKMDRSTIQSTLTQRFAEYSGQTQPTVQIFADKQAIHDDVLFALLQAKTAGFSRIGFVTSPNN